MSTVDYSPFEEWKVAAMMATQRGYNASGPEWSELEDNTLLEVVTEIGSEDWDEIARWLLAMAPREDGVVRTGLACKKRYHTLTYDGPCESTGKRWSDSDKALVKKYYPRFGPELWRVFPGRSYLAVQNRANEDGVNCEAFLRGTQTGRYGNIEHEFIADFCDRVDVSTIAKVLRRPEEGVRNKVAAARHSSVPAPECDPPQDDCAEQPDVIYSLGANCYPVAYWDVNMGWILLFGKYKGMALCDVPWGYLTWMNTATAWLPTEIIAAANDIAQSRKEKRAEAIEANMQEEDDASQETTGLLARFAAWLYRCTHPEAEEATQ